MLGRTGDDLVSGSKAPHPACEIMLWHQEEHPRELKWANDFLLPCCHTGGWQGHHTPS